MKNQKLRKLITLFFLFAFTLLQFQCEQPELPQSTSSSARVGAVKSLPGRIEAEDYDAMQDVIPEPVKNDDGDQDVGYIDDDDWMEYNINVATAGTYSLNLRIASPTGSGRLEIRNASGDDLASVKIPNTGGWQTWSTINTTINLTAGPQKLRIYAVSGGWNINWFEADLTAAADSKQIPARLEAENYDNMDGVVAERTKDVGGGQNVGYLNDGDWMDYAINVPSPGVYALNVRVASPAPGGKLEFRSTSGKVLARFDIPNTGGWQTWSTISTTVNLNAGPQTLRLYIVSGDWNINWFELLTTGNKPGGSSGSGRVVGGGSGDLLVDGNVLGIKAGETVTITAGKYRSITLINLVGNSSSRIQVLTNGLVEVVGGSFDLKNVQYTTVSGKSDADDNTQNIVVRDNTYRATQLTNCKRGLTLEKIKYVNIDDFSIYNTTDDQNYNGSDASASLIDLKLLSIEWNDAGGVGLGGSFSLLSNSGFCKNLEIAYCVYRNRPDAGNVFMAGNVEDYNIHHNAIDNVNTRNNNHNGIFHLTGNGSFYNNRCTNHSGQLLRAWTFSQGNKVQDVLIYNNIVWNSRKYSAFEVQSFPTLVGLGRSTYCNAKIYNNTAGQLDKEDNTFVGVVVDVYGLFGGTVQLYNNLSYGQKNPGKSGGVFSLQGNTNVIVNRGNKYFSSAEEAGLVDEVRFQLRGDSDAKKAGITGGPSVDFYGNPRSNPPSAGAVE